MFYNQTCYLSGGGINWSWYCLAILHDDMTATVLLHDRLHNDTWPKHPSVMAGGFRMVARKHLEGEHNGMREAIALTVYANNREVTAPLRNPGEVFSYPDFPNGPWHRY